MSEQALTLEQIHQESLHVLQKIIDICEELNINYFMAYGSLIGTVRHHGFIPWDDDLDLIMLRPEYEKFKEYCTTHEKELYPFKLMGRDNTPGYPFTINRFCDLRYRMETENVPDVGMGMFVDIFPLDGAGNNLEEGLNKLGKKKWFNVNCLFSALNKKFIPSSRGLVHTIAKWPVHLFSRLMGPDYFLNRLEKLKDTYSYDDSRYVACAIWDRTISLKEKAHFQEYIYMDFEGMQVKVPKEYDAVLRSSYGDYMQLPPEEKRIPLHDYRLYRKEEFFSHE